VLEFAGLTSEGYANTYYAATVKSMLTSWHNFFYASFDAGGFVSVDKSPLGLWIEAASAKIFGFSGLSLLLPEALAGVLSVLLLYVLVSRPFGPVAGLLAKDYAREIASLGDLEDEGLLVRSEEGIQVMPRGVPLLRVIAMRFDATFTPGEGRHSKTI